MYKIPVLDAFAGFIVDETLFNIDNMPKIVYDYLSAKARCPVVYLKGESERFYDIMLDDREAIKGITKHFIEKHGFTDICHMTGRWDLQDARERYRGYEEAMLEEGLEVNSDMVFYGNYWKNQCKEAADFFTVEREKMPQAIVCANDFMAAAPSGLIAYFAISHLTSTGPLQNDNNLRRVSNHTYINQSSFSSSNTRLLSISFGVSLLISFALLSFENNVS